MNKTYCFHHHSHSHIPQYFSICKIKYSSTTACYCRILISVHCMRGLSPHHDKSIIYAWVSKARGLVPWYYNNNSRVPPPKKNETVSTDERCTHIRLASFFGSIKVRIGALSLRSLFYNSFPCSHGSFCLTRTPLILFFFSSSFLVSSAMLLLAYHIRTQAAIRTASNSFRGSIPSLLISFVCLLSRKML